MKTQKMLKYGKDCGTVKMSKTSKLGCSSWSLQARDTCPGAKNPDGSICQICQHCYALKGMYVFENVKHRRAENWKAWQAESFVDDFVAALNRVEYFRWFDSGDIANAALAEKILEICEKTPNTKHWIPTKSYTVASIAPIIEKLAALPNVTVRKSAKEIDREATNCSGLTCTVNKDSKAIGFECPAYKNEGKCGNCKACWNKAIKNISYPIH